jgi:putative methyltransferase (TIGR04325 family)
MNKVCKLRTSICVFACKRPNHLRACLSALLNNEEARDLDLRVYVDGPRQLSDEYAHQQVLSVCNQPWPFLSFKVIQREANEGLYKSLTGGIAETLCDYDSVIVVEDDIEASPFLIRYLLGGLSLYLDAKNVASIHGYTPPIKQQLPETFFLRGADCWGWATWRDQWDFFRHDAAAMAQEIRHQGLVHEFNLNGNYDYLGMLDARAAGLNNSWAICWHASCFLAGHYSLHPGRSLVRNIGLDNSGEHCGPSSALDVLPTDRPVVVSLIPIQENRKTMEAYADHYRNWHFPSRLSIKGKSGLHALIRTLVDFSLKKGIIRHTHLSLWLRIKKLVALRLSAVTLNSLPMTGPYESYTSALAVATGYDSPLIAQKVETAILDVLEGRAVYERDGTTFSSMPDLPIHRALMPFLSTSTTIADFGGGLGGLYINAPQLFPPGCRQLVIEQASMVAAGRRIASHHGLVIEFLDAETQNVPAVDILVFSGVLPYLADPWGQIAAILNASTPKVVILDRTAICSGPSRWNLQTNPGYYSRTITYPIQILNRKQLINSFPGYRLMKQWHNGFDAQHPEHIGMLLVRKN